MKINILAVAAILLLFSCTDKKVAEKKLMDEIMATHERVMNAENNLMDNKMAIDSLLKTNHFDPADSAAKKTAMRLQHTELTKADEAMDDWMHNFDPRKKGLSADEQLKYLEEQNKQIRHVDTLINAAVKSSTILLATPKK